MKYGFFIFAVLKMPGGVLVRDKEEHSMLAFYNFMKDKVDYWFDE